MTRPPVPPRARPPERRPGFFHVSPTLTSLDQFQYILYGADVAEIQILDRLSVRADSPDTLRRLGTLIIDAADELAARRRT